MPNSLHKDKLTRWARLAAGVVAIVLFIFVVMPLLSQIPAVDDMLESNRRNGIPAGTLYYSETPQFGNADNYMQNSRNHGCTKDSHKKSN
jgi:uncharacterized protein YybS (DUF2232 family)